MAALVSVGGVEEGFRFFVRREATGDVQIGTSEEGWIVDEVIRSDLLFLLAEAEDLVDFPGSVLYHL